MAKIEIGGSPAVLERVGTFLTNNSIRFKMVNDFGNHSAEDSEAYRRLIEKYG